MLVSGVVFFSSKYQRANNAPEHTSFSDHRLHARATSCSVGEWAQNFVPWAQNWVQMHLLFKQQGAKCGNYHCAGLKLANDTCAMHCAGYMIEPIELNQWFYKSEYFLEYTIFGFCAYVGF